MKTMNETKTHTPGPWEVVRGTMVVHQYQDEGAEFMVAQRVGNPNDASLMAAAPDLLAALENTMMLIEETQHWEHHSSRSRTDSILQQARATIAKAKEGR